jgi:putative peptidoglycan lipid II flippase
MKEYRSPAYAALVGMLVNVGLSIVLMHRLGTGGIALANGLSSLAGLALLTFSLSRRLPGPPYGPVLKGWLVMGLAAALMGLGTWWVARHLSLSAFHGVWHSSLRLFPLMGAAAAVYLGLLLLLGVPEARDFAKLVRRKLHL